MKQFFQFLPGDLVQVIEAPDQSLYHKSFVGQVGLIERKLTLEESVSSGNVYKVLVDQRTLHLHCLDMKLLSRVE